MGFFCVFLNISPPAIHFEVCFRKAGTASSLFMAAREPDSLMVRLQQTPGRAAADENVVDNVCIT